LIQTCVGSGVWFDLRLLGIDDFILMSMFLDDHTVTYIGQMMGVTTPAICHRIEKIECAFGGELFIRVKARRVLNDNGRDIARLCRMVLMVFGWNGIYGNQIKFGTTTTT